MLNKIKKINVMAVLITLIHFVITFFTDTLIFELDSINKINYWSCKAVLIVILYMFWNFIFKVFSKSNFYEEKKYFKYFLIYFIPIFILLLLAYPGTWLGSDVYNFYNLSIKGEFLYYLNYLTSVFYIIGYMLFPCPSGAIILQTILFGVVVAYIVKNFFDIYKTKLVYFLYVPFFIPHTIFYAFYANRPVMYGICYLLLICFLVIDLKKKKKLNLKKLIFISLLTAIVGFWRSESIYLIGAIPLFIFLTYTEKVSLKNILKILIVVLFSFVLISLPQKIVEFKYKSEVPSSRNLPMFVGPLSYMLTEDLNGDNLDKDLENIDKVLDVEIMRKYASYVDTPAVWMDGGCIKDYNKEEYDQFIKSYINIMKNNIPLFLKTKTLTFANASSIFVDTFTSKNLYNSDKDRLFNKKDTKTLFGYKVRQNTYKILEGKFSSSQHTNILYRLVGNLLIPLLFIGIIFIYSIVKKNLYYFLLSGMFIGHTCILFITAPASYFMYYFNIYMCGWILGIMFSIEFFIQNKSRLIKIYNSKKQFINYAFFGVLTTVINLLIYFILTSTLLDITNSLELQVANVISWVGAVIFAYATNRKYVFNSKNENKIKEISDFFIARLLTLFLDMIIMYLGVDLFNINDKFIKIISQITVILSNYVLSKIFVFKKKEQINNEVKFMKEKKCVDKLYIIIPAYNEEENIELVVKDWHKVVNKINKDSKLVIIDDGSRDNTYNKLLKLKKKYAQLDVITKENGGHGATVLYGYNYAIENGADYIFQTDSDGQTISEEFWHFWHQRNEYNAIIGSRKGRQDGFSRVIVTKVLKIVLFFVFHNDVEDANTPFRLINKNVLEDCCKKIPKDFNLSNVLLTVLLLKKDKEKVKFIPITFRPRQGGVNSINLKKITKIGIQAVKDFKQFNKTLKEIDEK